MCTATPQIIKDLDVTDKGSKIRKAGRKLDKDYLQPPKPPELPEAEAEAQTLPNAGEMIQAKRKKRKDTFLAGGAGTVQKTLMGE